MKKYTKSMLGVTLLEIMLVLAIAAMVIVMSIRYYQSATSAQQATATLEQIQSITAAADSLAQGAGGYAAAAVSTASIGPLLPTNGLVTLWNTNITVTGATATTYVVTIPQTPAAVCPVLSSKLKVNSHYTGVSACGAGAADFSYTYSST